MKLKKLLNLSSLFLFGFFSLADANSETQKPNILFIAIDDMNDWTGFLGGHPQAITPNMDKLAEKGVNFINAHCSAPGCSPSRNSLLFGVEPFKSGLYAFYDHNGIPSKVLNHYTPMTEFFKEHGYETYGAGKIHHRRNPSSKEWTEFYESGSPAKIKYVENIGFGEGKMSFRATLNPLEDHTDYRNATFGVEVLAREHKKPFFLAVGLIKPHLPFDAPKKFFDLYPEEVLPPPINPDDHNDIPAVGNAWVKVFDDDKNFKSRNGWSDVRRAYLACISWADYNVGRLLDALEKSPYASNTIIVLWSDHGYALGEKNHFRKFALWEETTRVPFIIFDAREENSMKCRTVADGVSLINIYRTLAELANLKVPDYVDGFSLVPQLKDSLNAIEKPAICTWGRGNYTLRNRNWRYTQYYEGGEELYNHVVDPNEWTNLADDSEYSDILKELANHLPAKEVPLVMNGLEEWSICISADKPLK